MPIANVRGVNINYKIIGDHGPWVALSPGGRRDISGIEFLAGKVAETGHRVVIFDRRNCGASDVVIDGQDSEYEIWADDVHELLRQLGALPVFMGGSSSGCRTSLLFALRHPEGVRGLLLWRVTGGRFACERLAEEYYGQFIEAAKQGGMAKVCEMEHWKERIDARPQNRDALMKMNPDCCVAFLSSDSQSPETRISEISKRTQEFRRPYQKAETRFGRVPEAGCGANWSRQSHRLQLGTQAHESPQPPCSSHYKFPRL